MKKICFVPIIVLFGLSIYANPIALPTVEISELWFDDYDNWILELGYYGVNQNEFTVDSIFLHSSSGTVKLPSYIFSGNNGVLVITNDSLDSDFIIKRLGDTIKIVSYIIAESFEDCLIYGNIPGASINCPRVGQSISKYGRYFVKDKSPTIGALNDTLGICGTLRGIIYDKYAEPVQNRSFQLDFNFETSNNGEYVARVYSKPSTFDQVKYNTGHAIRLASISEISFIMEPDSIIEVDIHLLDTLFSGINDLLLNDDPVKIYPNPVSVNERIHISIDLPVISSDVWLEVVDINGRLVRKEEINQQDHSVVSPAKRGFYFVSVWIDTQMISSGRILVI